MYKLYNKFQIFQFFIIISFLILSSKLNDKEIINKDMPYYNFLLNIIKYNNITKEIVKNTSITFKDKYKALLDNNEYFYIFYSNNVYVYFFKDKNIDGHTIYFNGINNLKDMKIIFKTLIDILSKNFNFDNINEIISNKGKLYQITENNIEVKHNNYSILEIFDIFYKDIYSINNSNDKINLKINGYSIGGPESQLFTLLLLEKYPNKFDIEIYNIESWFGGDKKIYDDLINNVKLFNIYNGKSIFYFFNKIQQKYFKTDYLITNINIENNLKDIIKYNIKPFPAGLINYILKYHSINNISMD